MNFSQIENLISLQNIPQNVSAILIGGSQIYAPDEYSDIDIGFVWSVAPTTEDRLQAIQLFKQVEIVNFKSEDRGHPDLGRSDNIFSSGKKIDLIHITLAQIERCKEVLLKKPGLNLHYQALFWNLLNGHYIYGNKICSFEYPPLLKKTVIETQEPQIYPEDLELARNRQDEFFYNLTLAQIQRAEFLLFLAKHEEFFVSFKQTQKQRERVYLNSNKDTRSTNQSPYLDLPLIALDESREPHQTTSSI